MSETKLDILREAETNIHKLVSIHIDRKRYETKPIITAIELYELGDVGAHRELFKEVTGDQEDISIPRDRQRIHLKQDDHFYSQKEIKIFINGRERETVETSLSFDEVVKLAFDNPPTGPTTLFTITYRSGPKKNPEGTLVAGQSVKIKKGMKFNVTPTDKS